jgi:hypothetical protein
MDDCDVANRVIGVPSRQPCLHGVNVYESVTFAVQPRLSRGRKRPRG